MVLGCAGSRVDQTASALAGSKAAYDFNMKAAGDLYLKGVITDDQKAQVIKYANIYITAHNAVVDALASYVEVKDLQDISPEELAAKEQAIKDLCIYLGLRSANLIVYIQQLTGGDE